MSTLKLRGGNPTTDMKPAINRFKNILEPIFFNKGFRRISGNSHTMYSKSTNTVVIVTSSPSNVKDFVNIRDKSKKLRKKYKDCYVYLIFSRDYSEWKDKEVYQGTLKRILKINQINGISTGISNLPNILEGIENKDNFWFIG